MLDLTALGLRWEPRTLSILRIMVGSTPILRPYLRADPPSADQGRPGKRKFND
jgi:hypothetical protein